MLKDLVRESYSASRTMGVVALFLISLALLAVAVVHGISQRSSQGDLPVFVVSLGCGVLGLFGSMIWYSRKAREYVRAESAELDLSHPGFYDYCRQWQAKVDEITSSSTY